MQFSIILILFYFGFVGHPNGRRGKAITGKGTPEERPAKQQVDRLLKQCKKYINKGQTHRANILLKKAEKMSDSLHYKDGLEHVYVSKGNFLLSQRNPDSAEVVLKEGLHRFPHGERRNEMYSYLGTAYRMKGETLKAIGAYHKAQALIDSSKNPSQLARLKLNMATSYYNSGNKGQAFNYFYQAINIAKAASDSTFLAVALNNLGNTYNQEKDYKNAQYYLKQSIKVSKAVGFKVNELRSFVNMGNTKRKQGNYSSALTYYKKASVLHKKVRPGQPPRTILYNTGLTYLNEGKLNKAAKKFHQSLKYSRQGHIGIGVYYNTMGLGRVAEKKGHNSKAIKWSKKSLKAARRLNNASFESQAYQRLYKLNKKFGNYKEALTQLEAAKDITDSLNKAEYKQKLAKYGTKLKVARKNRINKLLSQKEKQQQKALATQRWLIVCAVIIILLLIFIAYLQYQSQKRKQRSIRLLHEKQNELEKMNKEKNRLFAIVSHDLRSPLSAMHGMLYLLRGDNMDDEERQQLLDSLEGSILQNLNVMENLLTWARKQLSGIQVKPTVIDIKETVNEILSDHKFQAEQKNIDLVNTVPEDLQAKADMDMFRLILRNLINNSIKFCNEGDHIRIEGHQIDGQIEIKVNDSGVGMSEEQRLAIFSEKLTSSSGTDNEEGSGLGLNLCRDFVEAQGGTIYVESEESVGTVCSFTLPAA